MAADVDMADGLPDVTSQPASHPDAQATVTDFLDYTEFFPADLTRSLTLITKLDNGYLQSTDKVHQLTTIYGKLPTLPAGHRPDPRTLRKQLSAALDHAIHCRESAYAEAARLYDVAERHCNRLASIKRKLQALPQPPSRDPTPAPISPRTTRPRQADAERTPRITLHVDGARSAATARTGGSTARPRQRSRKITIPGDVLPPPNPDSPPPSTVTDWEESAPSSPVGNTDTYDEAPSQPKRGGKPGRVKVPKPQRQKSAIPKAPRVRPPGVMGTNVHSAVAGISTSNALALLTPPPPDAKPGSKWQPWFKLTEYEMALLRKSMKKNAIWTPSDTMVRRQLHITGRGRENYLKAKAEAEAAGVPLLDEDPVDPQKKVLAPGEVSFQPSSKNEADLINRGMKLNEAKKLKKETMAREQAARDAMEIEEASRKITDAGNMFKNLFSQPSTDGDSVVVAVPATESKKDKPAKKRKREQTPEASTADANDSSNTAKERVTRSPGPKKIKLSHSAARPDQAPAPSALQDTSPQPTDTTAPPTTSIPSPKRKQTPNTSLTDTHNASLPPNTTSAPTTTTTTAATAAGTRSRRTSVGPKATPPPAPSHETLAPAPPPTAPSTSTRRPGSRSASTKAASAEPPATKREPRELRELRRGSNVSLPASSTVAEGAGSGTEGAPRASGRRGRRPAPGLVTADEDGKGKVSVGKRVAAPRRRGGGQGRKEKEKEQVLSTVEEGWDDIDPDEPRYCVCGGVSYGTMILCENDADCEKEWFHLGCVGLEDIPPRRTKWYCPDCRVKLHIDEKGNAAEPPKRR